jgi:hypothetical protein
VKRLWRKGAQCRRGQSVLLLAVEQRFCLFSFYAQVIWRDIKVYKHYAYIVSEHRDHGMQVKSLTNNEEMQTGTFSPPDTDFGSLHARMHS